VTPARPGPSLRAAALAVLCVVATSGCAEWFASSEPEIDPSKPPAPATAAARVETPSDPSDPERARLQQDMARLTSEIAEMQNALARLTASARLYDDRLDAVERRLRERAATGGPSDPSLPPRWSPPPGSGSPTAPASSASAEELFQAARTEYEAGNRDSAVLKLHELILGFPDHPARERAQLLMADIHYAQREYRAALAQMDALLAAAPRGPRAAEALLRIGLCRRALGDESAARQSWERLVADYPTSEAAGRARQLLRADRKG